MNGNYYRVGPNYAGYFDDGASPPEGAIPCTPPSNGRDVWDGSSWVPFVDTSRDLTPSEFEYLLAYTGLEDIWYGLEQLYKPSDRAKYAFLRGLKKKGTFVQAETLSLVSQFRPAASGIDPAVDLSENTIKAAWELATQSGV